MKVVLLSHTREAELLSAAAARGCYSSLSAGRLMEKIGDNPAEIGKILDMVLSSGHHSVIEHAVFSFSVSGVSRALTHQLVRHRIASYSQQSQRYVDAKRARYVIPPGIGERPELRKKFDAFITYSWELYRELQDEGIPSEDARFVLPNAAQTNIAITMNARELMHFFALRCCRRAQWEIRSMADEMLRLVKEVAPIIFKNAGAACVGLEYCPEGPDRTCGRVPTLEGLKEKWSKETREEKEDIE